MSKEGVEFVKWFSEIDRNSVKVAGGKGANLGEMYNNQVPVPPGFVVTAQAYDYFIEKAGIKNAMKKLLDGIDYNNTTQLDEVTKQIREMISSSEMPDEMGEEIVEAYENIDVDFSKRSAHEIIGRRPEHEFVAVRSSATAEDLEDASFAGQQDTYLNIKGRSELIDAVKRCFASLFTARATYYRNKKGFKHEETSLAVIVQKMVDSDKSGVMFSTDPSYNEDNIIIEAVYGLGEGIVSGRITPDRYVVSKEFKIIEKKISNKKTAITRNSAGGKIEVKLTPERAEAQVLREEEILKLAEIAINLEGHYEKPQDIEFAIENREIYIVQTRAITTAKNKIERKSEKIKGDVVLEGLAASPGMASGKIKIVKSMDDLPKVQEGDILVTKMTNPDMVVTMQRASGIVTDEGGLTAHAAIVSREMGIPCIVGTGEATTKLKEGEMITVDGYDGKIYKGKLAETKKKEVQKIEAKTKTNIKVIVDLPSFAERASKSGVKSVGLSRIEGIIAESGKHPNYFLEKGKIEDYEDVVFKGVKGIAKYFDELWVRTSDIRSDEFQNLEGASEIKEANPMLGMHGIRFGLKNREILKAELKALKKISEEGKNVGVLLPQVILVEEVRKVKEMVKEIDAVKLKIGVMIETPAAVQLIRELCEEGIDFVSFGTNDLTQYILAVDRGNEQVQDLYDEMHPAVLHQLEYVIRVAKRNGVETSICGQSGSKREMVKFLVERGIDSISVNADMAKDISDYIAELENADSGDGPLQKEIESKQEEKAEPGFEIPSDSVPINELQEGEVTEQEEMQQEEKEKTSEEILQESDDFWGDSEENNEEEKKEGLDIF